MSALSDVIGNVTAVATAQVSIVTTIIGVITDNPLLFALVGCAFIGIAVKYGSRLLRKARGMA